MHVTEKLTGYIVHNLIKNALEAMEYRGTLTLRAYTTGDRVALEVEDTGVGIPLTQIEHIFDLFRSTKKSSGYGLWSARRNAVRIHGSLHVKSSPGNGATFTLLLPQK
ncbi:MAG: ATP-binding protein [Ktedonobacteraceae bacterium]